MFGRVSESRCQCSCRRRKSKESGARTLCSPPQLFSACRPVRRPRVSAIDKDQNFALSAVVQGAWSIGLQRAQEAPLDAANRSVGLVRRSGANISLRSRQPQRLRVDILLSPVATTRITSRCPHGSTSALGERRDQIFRESERYWRDFWSRSAVEFEDQNLSALVSQSVLAGMLSVARQSCTGAVRQLDKRKDRPRPARRLHEPMYHAIRSGALSNHVEQHLPYIDLRRPAAAFRGTRVRPRCRARSSAFGVPVPSQTIARPAPPWGYEVCETPWTSRACGGTIFTRSMSRSQRKSCSKRLPSFWQLT